LKNSDHAIFHVQDVLEWLPERQFIFKRQKSWQKTPTVDMAVLQ